MSVSLAHGYLKWSRRLNFILRVYTQIQTIGTQQENQYLDKIARKRKCKLYEKG
jgi:hypothetical protein